MLIADLVCDHAVARRYGVTLLLRKRSAVTQWHGEHYRDIAKPQRSLASGTLSSLLLEGHERVLDVECGDGTITMQLADRISPHPASNRNSGNVTQRHLHCLQDDRFLTDGSQLPAAASK